MLSYSRSFLIGQLRRFKNGTVKRFSRSLAPCVFRPVSQGLDLRAFGEGDGAWIVPMNLIKPGWICYCVGVGVNATFDIALASQTGVYVYSFDPTPRAIEYMTKLSYDRNRLTFLPIGVWNNEVEVKFYSPADNRSVNHSIQDIHGTGVYFLAKCKRISTLMRELGHTKLDLLKLDIEGSWQPVLDNLIAEQIGVSVLCVEFDTPTSLPRVAAMIRKLQAVGLRLVHLNRENYVFVHGDLL